MGRINQLPETLVSQIKAGEVVERPASALKEMMENAIDSGAKNIKASIEKGGLSLLQVEDDGEGIERDDLPLAFARHATSKIKTFEDLSTAATMGFRGEALASLASISKCKIVSKRADAEAFEIEAEEGRVGSINASTRRDGTTVSARDLFFYVPARRKFLKSEQTEASHCREAFARCALSRPDISMSFLRDGKALYRLPAQSALDRAKALVSRCFDGEVALVDAKYEKYSITGFAAPVGALPTGRETQMLFVNHRFARDRLLTHAAKEALIQSRGLGREREVAFVLFFELPIEQVDANAHPAKTEVRFKDPRAAHQFVYKALADALATLPPSKDESTASRGAPLSAKHFESDQDLFGHSSPSHGGLDQRPDVANEAEKFLGLLRSGLCAWDSSAGLWVAPPNSLAIAELAEQLSELAQAGELAGCQQLIPARVEGLDGVRGTLRARKNQIQALGVELEWDESEQGSCMVTYAPEGFDNCDWGVSLSAMATALSMGKADALSLSMAMASGLPPVFDKQDVWEMARSWMAKRRLARELPGAFLMEFPD